MARAFTSGFEIANNTAGHEWANAGVSSAARSTTSPRSGLACGLVSSLVSATPAGWGVSFIATADGGPYYARFYLAVDTAPSADNCIAAFITGANVTSTTVNDAQIRLTSSRTLRLFAANSAVGSASAALTVGQYYMVELEVDNTPGAGSKIVRAYLDGTQFAGTTTSSDVGGNISGIALGGNLIAEAQTTGAWRFDDAAVNNSSGGSQNGRVPAGKVIILRPNAAGDSNQWLDTAAAAGSTNNYTLVDETSPNDATDLVQSATLNNTDLYNMEASGIGASDTVNAISVYLRRRNDTADAATAVATVVRKTSGGTDAVGTAVVPNTTTWRTGGTTSSTVLTPSYVAYVDPDGAAWTQSTLDSMQVGCRITTGGTNRVQVSAVWVYVDYTPSSTINTSIATATETDSALALVFTKARALGTGTETDSAIVLGRTKLRSIGLATAETDTASALVGSKSRTLGLASEADSAIALGRLKSTSIALATAETDTALALDANKSRALGLAPETDTALALDPNKAVALGLASEADTASVLSTADQKPINTATEADSAQALVFTKSRVLGVAAEADAALALVPAKTRAVGLAGETDTAIALAWAKTKPLGVASGTDSAQALGRTKARAVGVAAEAGEAFALSTPFSGTLGTASSIVVGLPLAVVKSVAISRADSTQTALSVSPTKRSTLAGATETDSAAALARVFDQAIARADSTDAALPLAGSKARLVGTASEADTALALTKTGGAPTVPQDPTVFVRQQVAIRVSSGRTTVRAAGSRRVTL